MTLRARLIPVLLLAASSAVPLTAQGSRPWTNASMSPDARAAAVVAHRGRCSSSRHTAPHGANSSPSCANGGSCRR